jgi:hypothetical protein
MKYLPRLTYYVYRNGRRYYRGVTHAPRFLSWYRQGETYLGNTLTTITRIWGGVALTFSDGHTLFVTVDDYAPGVYRRRR